MRYVFEPDDSYPGFGYDIGYEYAIANDGDFVSEAEIVGKVSELPENFVEQALTFAEMVFENTISEVKEWLANQESATAA